jgi:wyosine [tRNA(Phe)-imidazoG37] synthetase (radical SAM superfamily)
MNSKANLYNMKKPDYFYGPVYSRRLGFSLGVDLLPSKVCSYECLYCQIGRTLKKSCNRFSWVKIPQMKQQLEQIMKSGRPIEYITISGSGEPTLHKNLDKIITVLREISHGRYPICLITNSSLLYLPQVQKELKGLDAVMPSLDAPDQKIFEKINRPVKGLDFNKMVDGIEDFRFKFKGKFWLEIMLLKNINDSRESLLKFKELINRIKPDKVFLNLPTRPAPLVEKSLMPSKARIKEAVKIFGKLCGQVEFKKAKKSRKLLNLSDQVLLDSLRRRPQTVKQLSIALQADESNTAKRINFLKSEGKIKLILKGKEKYYQG